MGHNMASWKVLEGMLIDLEKKGVIIPENILADLRSAKSMIKLHCTQAIGAGDALQKAEELSANVEAYLAEEAQKIFGSEKVDAWLRRLEEANAEICEEPCIRKQVCDGSSQRPKVGKSRTNQRLASWTNIGNC